MIENQLTYWKAQLSGPIPVLDLHTDYPRPKLQTYRGASHSFILSENLTQSLRELSKQESATLFITLLSCFQTLLHRYTSQEDLIVGIPVAGRNREELESLIGILINMLPLRTKLSRDLTFRELLGRTRETALMAYAHQDLPFEKLIQELRPERDLSRSPLFQVLFQLRNFPRHEAQAGNLVLKEYEFKPETALYDITVIEEKSGELIAKSQNLVYRKREWFVSPEDNKV